MHENQQLHQEQQQEEQERNHPVEETRIQRPVDVREKRKRAIAKYTAIAGFLFALGDILAEQITYPIGNIDGMYFAYLAVPFFIFSVFVAVYAYSYRFVKIAWKNPRVRFLSILAGIAYATFYIFITNMVSTPDLPMPPNLRGFILPFQVYGQMAIWPDVEFWSPQLNLVGYFSVGNVLVVSSLAVLTAFSVALLAHNIGIKSGKQDPSSLVGSFLTSLSTNACCCCVPVIFPALFAIFGLGTSSSTAGDFASQTMPIFNLLWIATLLFLLTSILLSSVKRAGVCGR